MARRDFGTVRRLPSGRWQARYRTPAGDRFTAERTFATRTEAASYLAGVQADLDRGTYVDPVAGAETFGHYATTWLAQRADLRPRTAELYQGLLSRHLLPHLATVPLARLTPAMVRRWHAGRLQSGLGPSTVAKSYRLLKTILNTAVADEILPATHACSAEPAANAHPSGCHRRCSRRTPWRRPSSLAGGCSSCWPPGPGCAGASRCAAPQQHRPRARTRDGCGPAGRDRLRGASSAHRRPTRDDVRSTCPRICSRSSPTISSTGSGPAQTPGCSAGRSAPLWSVATSPSTGPALAPRSICLTFGSTTCVTSPRRWPQPLVQPPASSWRAWATPRHGRP